MSKFLVPLAVLVVATLQTIGNTATAQNDAAVKKAFEQPMLKGGPFASSPCTDFTDLFNEAAERQQGKVKADQLRMALFGWFEGYMEGFRLTTAAI